MRIVNTTEDIDPLSVFIDGSIRATANRGSFSAEVTAPAGRPISFVLMEKDSALRRDTLYYTLGGSGKIILFTRGSKKNLVEFRRVIQDTLLPMGSANSVIRFTHMAELVDKAVTLEVWVKGAGRLFPEDFDPGLSSPSYTDIAPGTYTFEIREYRTTNVLIELPNVVIQSGKSYMLYTYDAQPPNVDAMGVSVFD
ncbi:MAG: hypothetical protein HQ472_01975 [Ignavibacteria bacterium]|nr:hypothetical protein [Ignavibacteria bacterium]